MSNEVDVLIVGAGPVGLMLAVELKRLGIECHIIDKNRERAIESRAIAENAGTLELCGKLDKKLVEKELKQGNKELKFMPTLITSARSVSISLTCQVIIHLCLCFLNMKPKDCSKSNCKN